MEIPRLNDVIKALECEEWRPSVCKKCMYGFLDDHGDNPTWSCDEIRIHEETLFWLKLYQHLINEEQIKNG